MVMFACLRKDPSLTLHFTLWYRQVTDKRTRRESGIQFHSFAPRACAVYHRAATRAHGYNTATGLSAYFYTLISHHFFLARILNLVPFLLTPPVVPFIFAR